MTPAVSARATPAALAPERTCYIASAAKVLALGLRVGMPAAPEATYPRLAAALRASTWLTARLLGELLACRVRDAGILVAPGDDYVVDRTRAVHGVRVGLNDGVPDDRLRPALATLHRLVLVGPSAS